jgi:hypothetical protein
LNIKKDDEFKPETLGINSKWEAVFVKKIKYILIDI